MKIDFNNLRKNIAHKYNRVTNTLNKNTHNVDGYVEVNGKYLNHEKAIIVDVEDLQNDMDDLRNVLVTLICCYEENNPEYKSLHDEIKLSEFNATEEE